MTSLLFGFKTEKLREPFVSYRRDSDVTRHWWTKDQILNNVRVKGTTIIPAEVHLHHLMSRKVRQNHTTWFVSNCDNTNGANLRWEYGQELLKVF